MSIPFLGPLVSVDFPVPTGSSEDPDTALYATSSNDNFPSFFRFVTTAGDTSGEFFAELLLDVEVMRNTFRLVNVGDTDGDAVGGGGDDEVGDEISRASLGESWPEMTMFLLRRKGVLLCCPDGPKMKESSQPLLSSV